jgi:hypothetical protein
MILGFVRSGTFGLWQIVEDGVQQRAAHFDDHQDNEKTFA